MTFIPKEATKGFEPIAGLGGEWRELSDEEFAKLDAVLGGGLDRWYDKADDAGKKKKTATSVGGE